MDVVVSRSVSPILLNVGSSFRSQPVRVESNQVRARIVRCSMPCIPASKEPTLISIVRCKLATKQNLQLLCYKDSSVDVLVVRCAFNVLARKCIRRKLRLCILPKKNLCCFVAHSPALLAVDETSSSSSASSLRIS